MLPQTLSEFLTESEIETVFDVITSPKEKFIYYSNPNKESKVKYVTDKINGNDELFYALVVHLADTVDFETALDTFDTYSIYTEEERDKAFEEYISQLVESTIEAEVDTRSFLYNYIDRETLHEDMYNQTTYIEAFSWNRHEEFEIIIEGTTYYVYPE